MNEQQWRNLVASQTAQQYAEDTRLHAQPESAWMEAAYNAGMMNQAPLTGQRFMLENANQPLEVKLPNAALPPEVHSPLQAVIDFATRPVGMVVIGAGLWWILTRK